MTSAVEYLEKYSVAPAPSRDYYGIRILPNEVLVYLWKISHGPHKTPIVRKVSFDEFTIDKSLQDEIHQVFGGSLLEFVRDLAEKGTDCWSKQFGELDRGWARVLMEGRSMRKTDAKNVVSQYDKKRGVKGNSNLTGHKGNIMLKARSKVLAKTPLNIVKTNPAAKRIIDTSARVETTSSMPREISLKGLNDVCSKVSNSIFEKSKSLSKNTSRSAKNEKTNLDQDKTLVRYKTTDREKNTMADRETVMINLKTLPTAKIETDKIAQRTNKSIKSSKSHILKTHEALTKEFASLQKKDVNLDASICENAKRVSNASSFEGTRYFSCLDYLESSAGGDYKKSTKSSSGNYEIENPWSSNSSIASINSIKKESVFNSKADEIAYLRNKYKKAQEYLAEQLAAKERKMPDKCKPKSKESVRKNAKKSLLHEPGTSSRFSNTVISDVGARDVIDKIMTLDTGENKNLKQSNLKMSLFRKTSLASSKSNNLPEKPRLQFGTERYYKKSK